MPAKKKARKKPVKKKAAARKKTAPRKKAAKTNGSGRWMQQSIPRKEDGRLIRGQGKFVDDYKFPGMLHLFGPGRRLCPDRGGDCQAGAALFGNRP
jgi:hypothetical protein